MRVTLCCAAAMRARAGAARLCREDDFALLLPGFLLTAKCGSKSTRPSECLALRLCNSDARAGHEVHFTWTQSRAESFRIFSRGG